LGVRPPPVPCLDRRPAVPPPGCRGRLAHRRRHLRRRAAVQLPHPLHRAVGGGAAPPPLRLPAPLPCRRHERADAGALGVSVAWWPAQSWPWPTAAATG